MPTSDPEASGDVMFAFALLALVVGLLAPRDEREKRLATLMATVLNVAPDSASGWFLRAWDLRQSGLFVDWDGSRWRSPREVSDADLADSRRTVRPIVASVSRGMRSIVRNQQGPLGNGPLGRLD